MTDGGGADVVFDTSGLMFAQSVEAAARWTAAVISAPTDGKAMFNLRSVYRKELRVHGVDTRPMDVVASGKLLAEMRGGFESGKFRVTLGEAWRSRRRWKRMSWPGAGKGRFYLRPND